MTVFEKKINVNIDRFINARLPALPYRTTFIRRHEIPISVAFSGAPYGAELSFNAYYYSGQIIPGRLSPRHISASAVCTITSKNQAKAAVIELINVAMALRSFQHKKSLCGSVEIPLDIAFSDSPYGIELLFNAHYPNGETLRPKHTYVSVICNITSKNQAREVAIELINLAKELRRYAHKLKED
jgi:hypothetical protein